MSDSLRIVVAEDHETVRDGLVMILNSQKDMEVVGEAGDGRAAITMARELEPDIVLMDISMPNVNGLTAAATLKRVLPDTKIITLTRHTDDAYLQELFEAGVSGYVLKQSATANLVSAIRTVADGGSYLDPSIADKVFSGYTDRPHLRGEKSTTRLSNREEDVLRDIALGFSNREIAEKLDVSTKTVETHKANGMLKLNITSRREIIRYAILRGWLTES